jgi:hypothetical protein
MTGEDGKPVEGSRSEGEMLEKLIKCKLLADPHSTRRCKDRRGDARVPGTKFPRPTE